MAERRTRGGRAEFNWDDVKAAARKEVKLRENYLGQSVKTESSWIWSGSGGAMGASSADVARELEEVKRREQELLAQTLDHGGLVPRAGGRVSRHDVKELLQRGQLERDDKDTAVARAGLGQATRKGAGTGFATSEMLDGVGVVAAPPARALSSPPRVALDIAALQDGKATKKEHKKEHKKAHKKARKKEHKKEKKRRRHDSPDGRESRSASPRRRRHDSP